MDAAAMLRECRSRSGKTLREVAEAAGTSASTLSAYEHGRVTPSVETLDRIVRAAGFVSDVKLVRRYSEGSFRGTKGDELMRVLELAMAFPFRKRGDLRYPPFGR